MSVIKATNLGKINSNKLFTFSGKFHKALDEIKNAIKTQYETYFSKKSIIIENPWTTTVISGNFKSKSDSNKLKDITGKIKSINFSSKALTKDNDSEIAYYGKLYTQPKLFGLGVQKWRKKASLLISNINENARFEDLLGNDSITNAYELIAAGNKGRDYLICALNRYSDRKMVLYDYMENNSGWDFITGTKKSRDLLGMLDGQTHFFPDKNTKKIVAYGKKNRYTLTTRSDGSFEHSHMVIKGFSSKDKIFIPRDAKDTIVITDDGKTFRQKSEDDFFIGRNYYYSRSPVFKLDGCGSELVINPSQIKYY